MKESNYKGVMYVHAGGKFHLDDCLCAAMGKILGYRVERTIDKDITSKCQINDLVCDIGRKYDGVRFFDHHQPDTPMAQEVGLRTRFPFAKCAAAGLFWAAHARDVIKAIDGKVPDECLQEIIDNIDVSTIAPSDKIDTGDGELPQGVCTLSFLVNTFNPNDQDNRKFDAAFVYVVDYIVEPFLRNVINKSLAKIYGRKMVESAPVIEGTVIVLDQYVPWTATVIHCHKFDKCLYCVYPSMRGGWNGQVIPISPLVNEPRKSFPIEWAGLTDASLATVANEPWKEGENYFCHVARFLIAAPTKEAAIRMCLKAAHN